MHEMTLAGRILAVLFLGSTATLAGCERPAQPPEPAAESGPSTPAPAVAEPRPLAVPPPAIDRAALLQVLDEAASAYSAAQPLPGADLVGRRLVLRQAFGCFGPAAEPPAPAGLAQWSWSNDRKAINLRLQPAHWIDAPVAAAGKDHWEAVEGVWLTRPWLRTDAACPAATSEAPLADAAIEGPQTAGLAAVFSKGGSRLGRRDGKAFATTLRDVATPPSGFVMVLEGRFAPFPDGSATACHSPSPVRRPVCIAAAELDRVAFEQADGKLIAEWRPS